MRTTLTISDDLADEIKSKAGKLKLPAKEIINRALRRGLKELDRPEPRSFRSRPVKMGHKGGIDYNNIGALLSYAEGEDHR